MKGELLVKRKREIKLLVILDEMSIKKSCLKVIVYPQCLKSKRVKFIFWKHQLGSLFIFLRYVSMWISFALLIFAFLFWSGVHWLNKKGTWWLREIFVELFNISFRVWATSSRCLSHSYTIHSFFGLGMDIYGL